MRTTFNGVDIVDIRVQVFLVLVVVFQSNLDRHVVALTRDVNRFGDEFLAIGVEVGDKVDETVLGIESLASVFAVFHLLTLIGKDDGDAVVEVGQLTHAVGEGAIVIFKGLENGAVGLEGDAGAVHVGRSNRLHIVKRFAALVFLLAVLAVWIPEILLFAANIAAIVSLPKYIQKPCITRLKSQGGYSAVMLFHQLHYFFYAHITLAAVSFAVSREPSPFGFLDYAFERNPQICGIAIGALLFCGTWITYMSVEPLVSRLTKDVTPVFQVLYLSSCGC